MDKHFRDQSGFVSSPPVLLERLQAFSETPEYDYIRALSKRRLSVRRTEPKTFTPNSRVLFDYDSVLQIVPDPTIKIEENQQAWNDGCEVYILELYETLYPKSEFYDSIGCYHYYLKDFPLKRKHENGSFIGFVKQIIHCEENTVETYENQARYRNTMFGCSFMRDCGRICRIFSHGTKRSNTIIDVVQMEKAVDSLFTEGHVLSKDMYEALTTYEEEVCTKLRFNIETRLIDLYVDDKSEWPIAMQIECWTNSKNTLFWFPLAFYMGTIALIKNFVGRVQSELYDDYTLDEHLVRFIIPTPTSIFPFWNGFIGKYDNKFDIQDVVEFGYGADQDLDEWEEMLSELSNYRALY